MSNIEIYPSSWYYNACVQGFLEILARGLGKNGRDYVESKILQKDGRAVIPDTLMSAAFGTSDIPMPPGSSGWEEVPEEVSSLKRIAWWWVIKSYELGFIRKDDREKILNPGEKVETVIRFLCHKNGIYPNLIQIPWDTAKKIEFLNTWFSPVQDDGDIRCSFCGHNCTVVEGERIYDAYFTRTLSPHLGNAPGMFPNLFWDGNPNMIMCRYCRSYFMCFHITQRDRFFVNSNSFFMNWHLNQLISGQTSNNDRTPALTSIMQYDLQLRRAISGWALQSMELITFNQKEIGCHTISATLASLLVIPRISSLIRSIASPAVWENIVAERFDYLIIMAYKSLRFHLKGHGNQPQDNDIVGVGTGGLHRVIDLLELYCAIKANTVSGGLFMCYINMKDIGQAAKDAPLSTSDNAGKGIVFRLIELARLNKKTDVYHLLLRIYLANNKPFPEALTRLFQTNDKELFKSGIYAFVAGLPQQDANVTVQQVTEAN
ncbi:MAG TPA: type I-B CRISPR-associated protein Cas8b1/Cst1 [Peptococcaceae bacterium]|jgi:CRISPR-associated protein Cst1|nr:type I-B CRISPR-associated protein Cas8b1/Cst1 [Peptococcaceae bacterium]